jgi:hypothetical protein
MVQDAGAASQIAARWFSEIIPEPRQLNDVLADLTGFIAKLLDGRLPEKPRDPSTTLADLA